MNRRNFLKLSLVAAVAPLSTCSFIPQRPNILEIPDYECGTVYECAVAGSGSAGMPSGGGGSLYECGVAELINESQENWYNTGMLKMTKGIPS